MMFGVVQQETIEMVDGKEVKKVEKIKTRAGKSVKLAELLDEGRDRALATFQERVAAQQAASEAREESKSSDVKPSGKAGKFMVDSNGYSYWSHDGAPIEKKLVQEVRVGGGSLAEMTEAAEILGISSIKYYDLKQNRTQNYTFDFDRMLDPKGNTGVYLIYAYARICSILRKAGFDEKTANPADYVFTASNKSERDLALTILRLPEGIEAAAKDLMVNRLTD